MTDPARRLATIARHLAGGAPGACATPMPTRAADGAPRRLVMSAEEAVACVKDGDVVTVSKRKRE